MLPHDLEFWSVPPGFIFESFGLDNQPELFMQTEEKRPINLASMRVCAYGAFRQDEVVKVVGKMAMFSFESKLCHCVE